MIRSLALVCLLLNPAFARASGPDGERTDLAFDPLGRLIGVSGSAGASVRGYDEASRTITITPAGRPGHVFRYDEGMRLTSYEPPPPSPSGTAIPWTWSPDPDGALMSHTLGDGRSVAFTPFDAAGRVTAIGLARGVLDITYDPTGAVETATMPTAALGEARQALRWSHDGPLPTSVEYSGLVAGTLAFGYDPNTWELTSEQLDAHDALTYGYDADGTLIRAGVVSAPLTLTRHAGNGAIEGVDIGAVSTRGHRDPPPALA